MNKEKLAAFIAGMPKGENHVHLVGTMGKDLVLDLAKRNSIKLENENFFPAEFTNLDDFINAYIVSSTTLITAEDYRDLVIYVGEEGLKQNVIYRECMISDNIHLPRGVKIGTIMEGLRLGQEEMRKRGVEMVFIPSIGRSEEPEEGEAFIEMLADYGDMVAAVGLDGSEKTNPPKKFQKAFQRAKQLGFKTTAHAGEEGGPDSIIGALDDLGVDRIDHGVHAIDDPELVKRLADSKVLMTVCPDSNILLKVYPSLEEHPLKKLYDAGCAVSINSDDPGFFTNLNQNYIHVIESMNLTKEEVHQIAANAFLYSLGSEEIAGKNLELLDDYFARNSWD